MSSFTVNSPLVLKNNLSINNYSTANLNIITFTGANLYIDHDPVQTPVGGQVTSNKCAGTAIIKAGTSSVIVNNNKVTPSSLIFATMGWDGDTSSYSLIYPMSVVDPAGSKFTLIGKTADGTGNAPYDTKVYWLVVN
jgi:hypothetical protein